MEKCTTECSNGCRQVIVNMGCCNGGGAATADITIGENGNWHINGADTGIQAQGPKGDKGEQGIPGPAGASGVFSAMEAIFDGRADTVGTTYPLSKAITDYKALVVETSLYLAGSTVKDYEWIFNPTTSTSDVQHRVQRALRFEAGILRQNTIAWCFPTVNSVRVNEIQLIADGNTFAVTKIYGMK